MESNTPEIDQAYQQAIEMAKPGGSEAVETPAVQDDLVQDTQASLPSRLVSDAYDQAIQMTEPGSGDIGSDAPDAPGIVSGTTLDSAYDQAVDLAQPGGENESKGS